MNIEIIILWPSSSMVTGENLEGAKFDAGALNTIPENRVTSGQLVALLGGEVSRSCVSVQCQFPQEALGTIDFAHNLPKNSDPLDVIEMGHVDSPLDQAL